MKCFIVTVPSPMSWAGIGLVTNSVLVFNVRFFFFLSGHFNLLKISKNFNENFSKLFKFLHRFECFIKVL